MTDIREILSGVISERCSDDSVALLLSGGVDSLSLGFAADDLGKRVVAYTFQLGEWESSDSVAARRAADMFGWEFVLIKVPVDNLCNDFITLAEEYACKKKTQFECAFPFLYVFPVLSERFVLSGVGADGHYGLSRRAMTDVLGVKDRAESRRVFDSLRRKYYSSENPGGIIQLGTLASNYGKVLCLPYRDQSVFDHFIGMGWHDINKPQQKTPVLRAYSEQFRRCGTRKHLNLQLASGIDRVFESLLSSSLNTKNRKRVMDLCRDYAK